MRIETASSLEQALIAAARAAHPYECCGLLLGSADGGCVTIAEARPCRNVHPDPARHFEIDPVPLIAAHRAARSGGPAVVGYYHSHPTGSAEPSLTDRAQAAGDGRIWAIVTAGRIGWWHDGADGFEEAACIDAPE